MSLFKKHFLSAIYHIKQMNNNTGNKEWYKNDLKLIRNKIKK